MIVASVPFMLVYLPLFIAILGAVLYFVAKNARAQELGRLAYATGLLVFLFRVGHATLKLLD